MDERDFSASILLLNYIKLLMSGSEPIMHLSHRVTIKKSFILQTERDN